MMDEQQAEYASEVEANLTEIPDLQAMDADSARQWLMDYGFGVIVRYFKEDD